MTRLASVAVLALVFASSAHAATVPVTVDDNFFAPDPAQAQPGDLVQWTWAGSANHSVTSDGGESYDSGIKSSGTYGHSFNVPGNFAYHCVVQSGMTGTVSVAGIVGHVLADSDATDTVTPGDDGLAGVTVTRYDALDYQMNPSTAVPLDSTATDENGRYWFDNSPLPPFGFVTLHIDQQDGFATPSDVTGLPVTSTSVHEDKDFLLKGTGTVTGTVWNDVNGNGTHDSAEVGKSGVAVSLSGKRASTTDADGDYSFANAVPGPGTVDVTAPSGFAVIGSASRPINLQSPDYTASQDFFVRRPPALPGSGGATPGPAGSLPDRVKPRFLSLSLSPTAFRAFSSGPSVRSARARGTRITYRLSESATTTFRVQRALAGRRVRGRCVRPTRANRGRPRCKRYRTLRGSFRHRGVVGLNRFGFRGRVAGRRLRPGSYRLVAVAKDGAGNSSKRALGRFRIIR